MRPATAAGSLAGVKAVRRPSPPTARLRAWPPPARDPRRASAWATCYPRLARSSPTALSSAPRSIACTARSGHRQRLPACRKRPRPGRGRDHRRRLAHSQRGLLVPHGCPDGSRVWWRGRTASTPAARGHPRRDRLGGAQPDLRHLRRCERRLGTLTCSVRPRCWTGRRGGLDRGLRAPARAKPGRRVGCPPTESADAGPAADTSAPISPSPRCTRRPPARWRGDWRRDSRSSTSSCAAT